MERKKRIEQEVMKTLQCLDDLENIETSPFFYTRLQARIQDIDTQKERSTGKILSMPRLRLAFLTLLVIVNIFSAVFVLKNSQYQTDERQTNITAFATEYALTESDTDLLLIN